MNRYALAEEVKAKFTPVINEFIEKVENVDLETSTELLEMNLSDTELNPYTLCEVLECLGYERENQDDNGWQLDFWITMTKKGCRPLHVKGCGITFELILSEIE